MKRENWVEERVGRAMRVGIKCREKWGEVRGLWKRKETNVGESLQDKLLEGLCGTLLVRLKSDIS